MQNADTDCWRDNDGIVIVEFSELPSDNRTDHTHLPGEKVRAVARHVLKPEKIRLVRCVEEATRWVWEREETAREILESVFGVGDREALSGTLILIIPKQLSKYINQNIGDPLYHCISIGQ